MRKKGLTSPLLIMVGIVILLIIAGVIFYLTRIKPDLGVPYLPGVEVSYRNALDLAVEKNTPDYCNKITQGRSYGDYSISIEESIDVCKAEFAIETKNPDYCLTLKERPDRAGSISQRDVCLKGLANKLKNPELCEQLYSGKDEKYGQTYIETCKTQALDPEYEPVSKEPPAPI